MVADCTEAFVCSTWHLLCKYQPRIWVVDLSAVPVRVPFVFVVNLWQCTVKTGVAVWTKFTELCC